MKKLIFLIMIFFACSCSTTKTLPFARSSKKAHKTVKKMSKRQRIKNHNRNIDSNCNKIYRIKL